MVFFSGKDFLFFDLPIGFIPLEAFNATQESCKLVLCLSAIYLLAFTAGKTQYFQATTAAIFGTVIDAGGAVVPDPIVVSLKS